MAESPGQVLQRALRRELVAALGRIRDELAAGILPTLGRAGPEWAGSGIEDRLFRPLTNVSVANPAANVVLRSLLGLASEAPGASALAGLHGWGAPGAASATGIAYALRTDPAPGGLAFAVHLTGDGGQARLGLSAAGARAGAPLTLALAGGWTATVSGQATGALELELRDDGSVSLTTSTAGNFLRIDLARPDRGDRIGPLPGPGIKLGAVGFGGELKVGENAALSRTGWARTTGGAVELVPGGLGALLGGLGPMPLSLDLGLSPDRGVTLGGSTELRAHVPVALAAPGVALDGLDVVLDVGAADGQPVSVKAGVRTSARVSLPGAPVTMSFDGLGLELPFAFGDVPHMGFDVPTALAPDGAGIDLALPVVRASGTLHASAGGYSGGLSASLPPLEASAFGSLKLDPLSFMVMLGATFRPSIQVGFGFSVSGLGGAVGVHRRVDRDGLLRAVVDGSAADLLFPTDPSRSAERASAALDQIFPVARGTLVAGPMFQLSWGERLVSASVAVLMEISAQPRLTILGKLVVAIPDPAVPLILLQATVAGQFDPGEPSVLIVASLTGSQIVGVPLDGDICLLTRGGADATFVLSAGGFHPAFPLPRGVPPLRRIGTDLSTLPFLELRCEAYLALTSNTVQFGARVDLVAEVAKCGLRGHLSFDALIQISPLHFIVDVSIGIALTVFGEELVGIALDLRLEGPAKWHARGRGSIDLFLFSVSFDFEEEWGSAPGPPPLARNVGQLVADALSKPGAWLVRRRAGSPAAVSLTAAADAALTNGDLVDPYGTIGVHQDVVPLGLTIDRFDRIALDKPQRWDLTGAMIGSAPRELRERFSAAQYLTLSDDEALSRPSFEEYRAGLEFTAGDVVVDKLEPHTIGFETKQYTEDVEGPQRVDIEFVLAEVLLTSIAAARDAADATWWPQPADAVTVADATPLTVASAWSLSEVPIDAGPTSAELHEALGRDAFGNLMVVEAWEVAG